jgi:hypothetical protein
MLSIRSARTDIDARMYINETTINVLLSSAEPISPIFIDTLNSETCFPLAKHTYTAQAALNAALRSRKLLCLQRYLRIMD